MSNKGKIKIIPTITDLRSGSSNSLRNECIKSCRDNLSHSLAFRNVHVNKLINNNNNTRKNLTKL